MDIPTTARNSGFSVALARDGFATRHFETALALHGRIGARPWSALTRRDLEAV
jgi:hypothetical protein